MSERSDCGIVLLTHRRYTAGIPRFERPVAWGRCGDQPCSHIERPDCGSLLVSPRSTRCPLRHKRHLKHRALVRRRHLARLNQLRHPRPVRMRTRVQKRMRACGRSLAILGSSQTCGPMEFRPSIQMRPAVSCPPSSGSKNGVFRLSRALRGRPRQSKRHRHGSILAKLQRQPA